MDRMISAETGAALSLEQLKKCHDAEVRNFLSEKQIPAGIMNRCVPAVPDHAYGQAGGTVL